METIDNSSHTHLINVNVKVIKEHPYENEIILLSNLVKEKIILNTKLLYSVDVYKLRKQILTLRIDKLLNVLRTNYGSNISDILKTLPKTREIVGSEFVLYVKEKSASHQLYKYVCELYTILKSIDICEDAISRSVIYEKLSYE